MSRPEQPWHAEARRLRDQGVPKAEIARRLNKCRTSIYDALDPTFRAKREAVSNELHRRRYATDEAYREKRKASKRKDRVKLYDIRRIARHEAVVRGVDVTALYREWGCEL